MQNKQNQFELEKGIHTDFQEEMSYAGYLQLDKILSSQQRLSNHHDEMLFIIIHQTSELWMKLILHEMEAAIQCILDDDLEPSFKMFARISRIQQQLIQSWSVLSTLTPSEYMEFRECLGHASGFQSYQNRLIEFALGQKNAHVLPVFQHDPEIYEKMTRALHSPSVYDAAIKALAVRGLPIDEDVLHRDYSQTYQPNASVEEAWLTVYRNVDRYWDLYELAEKLVDIGSQQQTWRYMHMNTVERIIGYKKGTGGSSGVSYLKKSLDRSFFPELWTLRTKL
ncbi:MULTISPECIES: tryptophan 2,3-dioxygenase [Geobacillus]|jgi:tryptophan 2,3-dioxygenase|uniref:Tryptophan 2,3-dioxygenase n=2 Tax=Geobacillus thermodenitrificans TaxID=33940 RepID=T23O_GEOTN|nr:MULTISPECIES: tryptophan 2,3-dioxygenase [Geobacillus]A4IT59.1 RecName: Full=Tryptophan 2,3-dioxygenase; Short=TDO; AltName: Full=Tryptamin 2,3-dioxygenase; AltName: Full=Tryptophan oxygenase; Short=TO; Short=TRPO; AltName: Full=Tryptophan pyrrolase; AltName: Full=Tryptophanase [Geobacillus thermodenitrificans NG80-2]ABO68513.1 Tryptophan 2,3-dioxygenase [Geobacillus thermodenitrificans NG80-2]ARA98395.1 tryptophan 2,3-dioxygenase [Geobacillus thermodenitrificans]ARP44213.1 Tryptophan 2,3-di